MTWSRASFHQTSNRFRLGTPLVCQCGPQTKKTLRLKEPQRQDFMVPSLSLADSSALRDWFCHQVPKRWLEGSLRSKLSLEANFATEVEAVK